MRYVSTRGYGHDAPLAFCDIILEGLAPDGGLFLPERYPQVDAATLASWRALLDAEGYAALASELLSLYVDDIGAADLRALCDRAYSASAFGSTDVVDVADLGDGLLLGRISNGPTAAFKDMAMQLLGQLFEYELERRGEHLNIVGATSGDTGSSAEYAMLGKPSVTIFMLTPRGRMTPFQQAQMFSLDDPRIVNIAVDGVFDDCQDLVKAVASDLDFKARHRVGAVNSINWARVVAQVVYYVALYLRVTTEPGQRVSFAVPTGNFGNILAGHIAREMGVPIDTLILATNENDVLADFLRTGVYRVRSADETRATSSPSMDISKASNFERFVFDLLGRDPDRVAALFGDELGERGFFDLSGTPEFAGLRERFGFVAGSSTHADRLATIEWLDAERGIVVDPHTADGVHVASGLLAGPGVPIARPVVCLETALPVKFAETIEEALGRPVETPEKFRGLESLPGRVVDLDNDADALKELIVERLARLG
jgi:threonine synthase